MGFRLDVNPFEIFDDKWALVTAGGKDSFNTMTISWGGLGTLWEKPVVTVYVRPVLYTHQFMECNNYFTVSFYAENYRRILLLLGSRSGRDGDKVATAGLTPVFLEKGVTFREANMTLLCKKIYRHDMDMTAMPQEIVSDFYDYDDGVPHTMYIGEVIDRIRNPYM